MGTPKTIRLDDALEKKVKVYLKKNRMKFSQVVNLALRKFITEPQAIELVPIDMKEWQETAEKAYQTHKDAIDKLK